MKSVQKRFKLNFLDIVILVTTVLLIGFGIWNLMSKETEFTCTKPGQQHAVTLKNDAFSTEQLTIKQCDTLKISNLGTETYMLAFGVHEKHIEYPGFSQQVLKPNEFFVLEAVKAGSFRMHDHLRDKAFINFVIEEISN